MIKTFFFALLVCFSSSRTDVSRKDISSHLFLDTYCEPSEKPDHCRCILETYDIDHDIMEKTPKQVYTGTHMTKGCHEVPRQLYVGDRFVRPALKHEGAPQGDGGHGHGHHVRDSVCDLRLGNISVDMLYVWDEVVVPVEVFTEQERSGLSFKVDLGDATEEGHDWIRPNATDSSIVIHPTASHQGRFTCTLHAFLGGCHAATVFPVSIERIGREDKMVSWVSDHWMAIKMVKEMFLVMCILAVSVPAYKQYRLYYLYKQSEGSFWKSRYWKRMHMQEKMIFVAAWITPILFFSSLVCWVTVENPYVAMAPQCIREHSTVRWYGCGRAPAR